MKANAKYFVEIARKDLYFYVDCYQNFEKHSDRLLMLFMLYFGDYITEHKEEDEPVEEYINLLVTELCTEKFRQVLASLDHTKEQDAKELVEFVADKMHGAKIEWVHFGQNCRSRNQKWVNFI